MSDEILTEVLGLLYGDDTISKMNPAQSDLHGAAATHHQARQERKKRAITAGLSGVGAAAGAGGLVLSGKELRHGFKEAKAAKVAKPLMHTIKSKKIAAGLLPLEVAGLSGELMATKILHGDAKKKNPYAVKKDLGEMLNNARETKGKLTRATIPSPKKIAQKKGLEYRKKVGGKLRKIPTGSRGHAKVEKSDRVDVTWSGDIAKADADKQQIFGWASVVEVNGEPVVDLQGDFISTDEMEKAGYEYVMKSRKGGDMHLRDEWSPVQKSEMIESFIVTPEKRSALGLPESVPSGWWVGFQVRDPDVWAKVKSGERTGFSIHGRGHRAPVES